MRNLQLDGTRLDDEAALLRKSLSYFDSVHM